MAPKALVPVEMFPGIDRFRGHGPLLQTRAENASQGEVSPAPSP